MSKVLLTGGSGFIAAHILDKLIQRGHQVVTTVRSEDKAKKIRETYPQLSKAELDIVIVPDITKPGAFDEVVKIPGFEIVFHTASPVDFKWTDPRKDLVDPAVIGTTSILKAIVSEAPTVRRVVVTSSFAAILDEAHLEDPNTTFTEASWNPVTLAQLNKSNRTDYRISKTLAESLAWEFVKNPANGAKFDLVAINPTLVFGPVVNHIGSLEAINSSNSCIVQCITGQWKDAIPLTGAGCIYVDVRDCAEAHILAGLELPEAGGKRLLTSAGYFSNREIYEIVKKNFPEYADKLPSNNVEESNDRCIDKHYKYDNSATTKLLGIKWRQLEESVIDTVKSLKAWGA